MINTVFPIYDGYIPPMRERSYWLGNHPGKLYCTTGRLLPFQFSTSTSYTAITNIHLCNPITGAQIDDIYPYVNASDITVVTATGLSKKYVQYHGKYPLVGYTIPVGSYFLEISINGGSSYKSDIFYVSPSSIMDSTYKITFSNTKDIDDGEPICYQHSWAQIFYFIPDIKAGDHKIIEEIDERDGYEVIRSRTVVEVKKARIIIPESIYRGLIRLPLHDSVVILDVKNNKSWTANNIKIDDPSWSGGGAFCAITIEFSTETATVKNTNLNLS